MATADPAYILAPIGIIRSPLTALAEAPRQGDEGAPAAWIDVASPFTAGLLGIQPGGELLVLTWLHLAKRDTLQVHPRGDTSRPLIGVFAARAPHRPNPIGLHRVTVLEITTSAIRVAPLEAIDGTPVIDLKPLLTADIAAR